MVYIGHIPFGFFEESMRSFFTQFGDIRALKLSRSKKSARSRGYAFVEFEDLPTATIVAETMNEYMMFGQTLKAQVVPQSKIHEDLFKGVDGAYRKMPGAAIYRAKHNKQRTVKQEKERITYLTKKEEKKRAQLVKLGITYDFPGYKGDTSVAPVAEPVAVEESKEAAAEPKSPAAKKTSSKKKAASPSPAKAKKAAKAAESTPAPIAAAPVATPAKAKATKKAAEPKEEAPKVEAKETKTPSKKNKAPVTVSPAPSAKKQKTKK